MKTKLDCRKLNRPERNCLLIEAQKLRKKGLTYQQIADDLGISKSTVINWTCKRHAAKRKAYLKAYMTNPTKRAQRLKLERERYESEEYRQAVNARVSGRRKDPIGWAVAAARYIKQRAKKFNIPFKLTAQNILDAIPKDGKCPVFKTELSYGIKNHWNGASIDRIIPAIGYVPENIAVISFRANTLKRDGSIKEFKALIKWLENKHEDT